MSDVGNYFLPDSAPNAILYPDHAERTILGAILLDNLAFHQVDGSLDVGDFATDSHRRIYARMKLMIEDRQEVDIVTLTNRLTVERELEAIGGVSYLASLTEGIPAHPSIEGYIDIVRDRSLCRSLVTIGEAVTARAYACEEPGLETASWAVSQISRAADERQVRSEVFSAESLAEEAEYRLVDNPSSSIVIPTGLLPLDEFTNGGIRLGELWVIGGAPSRGKTTLARQIVKHAVCRDIPSYVHSGEMTKESWFDVTACLIEDMPAWKTREPRLMNLAEKEKLRRGLRALSKMPLKISDAGNIHLDRLIWLATSMVKQFHIMLFVVDFAQIINAPGRDDKERVSKVAHRLRQWAKDNNVATLLLSQMARPEGRNINTRPNMFGLKESGALEEAAHTVAMPFRPVDVESGKFTGDDELIFGKQRWGAIGSIPLRLNGPYLRFEPRETK